MLAPRHPPDRSTPQWPGRLGALGVAAVLLAPGPPAPADEAVTPPATHEQEQSAGGDVQDGALRVEGIPVGVDVPPPPGAVQLIARTGAPLMGFAGEPLDARLNRTAEAIEVATIGVAVGKGTGDLVSLGRFGDVRLHVEWLSPAGGRGQMAGNSGVFLQERYELQILGTLADAGPPANDDAGAIEGVQAPNRNVSTGPDTWQAFDVLFRAPRFDADGRRVAEARMSVYWNGELVHDDVPLEGPTRSSAVREEMPFPEVLDEEQRGVQLGRLLLQDHASGARDAVRFRNVWIAPRQPATTDPAHWTDGRWTRLLDQASSWWTIRGGAGTFQVDRSVRGHPVLIGQATPDTRSTYFATTQTWDDFELTFEARVDAGIDAGVVIRGTPEGGRHRRSGGLSGPQVAIDPAEGAWSGGVLEEDGRGWLAPLAEMPAAREAFRPGEWNRFRIVARGPVIRTWVNDAAAAHLFDAGQGRGHLGFEIRRPAAAGDGGDGNEAVDDPAADAVGPPLEVRYRDVRIRPLTPAPADG